MNRKYYSEKMTNSRKPSIKQRLSYKGRANFSKGNGIKTIQKVTSNHTGDSKSEVKLFTKHFDARNKLKAKMKNPKNTRNSLLSRSGWEKPNHNIPSKALEEIRKPSSRKDPGRSHSSEYSFVKKTIGLKRKINDNRESLFTGKSIKITAKNDLANSSSRRQSKTNKKEIKRKGLLKEIDNDISVSSMSWRSGRTHHQTNVADSFLREAKQLPSPMPKKSIPAKVIISNLHPKVTQEDIRELFGAIGSLLESRITNEGTAECIYESAEDAFTAYTKYHTRNLDGQPMVLRITTVEDSSQRQNQTSSNVRTSSRFGSDAHIPTSAYQIAGNRTTSATTKPVLFTVKL